MKCALPSSAAGRSYKRYSIPDRLRCPLVRLRNWGVAMLKFHRAMSFHAYSSKLWGLSLFAASVSLLGFSYAGGRRLNKVADNEADLHRAYETVPFCLRRLRASDSDR